MEEFVTQNALLGLLTAVILQALKNWDRFPWLQTPTGPDDKFNSRRNLIVSVATAAMVQLGIHREFHYDATKDLWDLHISGSVAGLKAGLWEWVQQWTAQHGAYKTMVVLPELIGNLARINSALLSFLESQKRSQATNVQVVPTPEVKL